jgi:hypothetical protein
MNTPKKPRWQAELEQIEKQNDGTIPPQKVVDFARDPSTALHSRFTWDDTKAAEQHRLWQARQVIRLHVTVIHNSVSAKKIKVRTYESCPSDRGANGAGYRPIKSIINDSDKYQELLSHVLAQFSYMRDRYRQLSELQPIFDAIDRVLPLGGANSQKRKTIERKAARRLNKGKQ